MTEKTFKIVFSVSGGISEDGRATVQVINKAMEEAAKDTEEENAVEMVYSPVITIPPEPWSEVWNTIALNYGGFGEYFSSVPY